MHKNAGTIGAGQKKKTAVVILDYQINLLSSFAKETQTELLAWGNKLLYIARANKLPVFFTQRGEQENRNRR